MWYKTKLYLCLTTRIIDGENKVLWICLCRGIYAQVVYIHHTSHLHLLLSQNPNRWSISRRRLSITGRENTSGCWDNCLIRIRIRNKVLTFYNLSTQAQLLRIVFFKSLSLDLRISKQETILKGPLLCFKTLKFASQINSGNWRTLLGTHTNTGLNLHLNFSSAFSTGQICGELIFEPGSPHLLCCVNRLTNRAANQRLPTSVNRMLTSQSCLALLHPQHGHDAPYMLILNKPGPISSSGLLECSQVL